MGIGFYLKQQRTLRDIALDEICRGTKISRQWLEAIESEKFSGLPGITFARGYVRAYADFIGLNVDDVLLRFDDEMRNSPSS